MRWWSLAFAIACTLLLLFFAVSSAGVTILEDPSAAMGAAHPLAALAGVLLLAADVVLPVPSSLVMVAHGALFGAIGGTLLSLAGSIASALIGFGIGRAGTRLVRRFVTDEEHARAGAMLERWGVVAIAASRPVPILAETVAILAGSSPLTWTRTTIAAAAGSIIPAAVYAWAGAHGPGFASHAAIFGGVVAVTALLMLAGRRIAPPAPHRG